ncbi:MAG TPA: hypothetical protein VGJ20_20575 [Xanthobacteraceae bacterium]|jgi:hypothetical protein
MQKPNETYLGDGLFASLDGGMITLRAPRPAGDHWPPRADSDHWVGLEMEVFFALIQFAKKEGWGRLIERAMKQGT